MSEPRVVTTADSVRDALAASPHWSSGESPKPGTGIRVPVEVRVTVSDPFLAYRRARTGQADVFLETTGGQPGWGYFGVDPVDGMTVYPDSVTRQGQSATLEALDGLLDSDHLVRGDCEVPYPCGVVGWLSYDIVRELEDLPAEATDDRLLPQLEAGVYDRFAAWEAPVDGNVTLRITACPRVEDDPQEAYERGRERALELARAVRDGDPTVEDPPVGGSTARFQSDCGRAAFADRVRRVKEYIRDGDTFQANISQRLVSPASVHPVAVYHALRQVNPAPYSCLLEFRAADLVSASPELLLERDGEFVRTEPIAGTRPRGDTDREDNRLETDLLTDEKERAEHAMLVDLERNDLGKVCAYGTVDVEEYRRVDRYSEVMHLVSNVTGRLRSNTSLASAIAAVFPGGTITGAPKPRTMEIIDEVEATRRGPYTGSVGIFGFDGALTLNIIIRTLVSHDDEYHLRVGAGIVHDSDPDSEYEETLDKGRALITAVDDALGDRGTLMLETAGEGDD